MPAPQRRRSRVRSPAKDAMKVRPANPKIVLLNKPFGVLTQFSGDDNEQTLKSCVPFKDVYPAGRLDKDSEGLLVLTNDGVIQHKITDPKYKMPKLYWAQVEGIPSTEALKALRDGVELNDGVTAPAEVFLMDEPAELWPRVPPIRERQAIPTAWLCLRITEGRNRQVRRMTAAVGYPTLRLIRAGVGPWTLRGMQPGEWREEPSVW